MFSVMSVSLFVHRGTPPLYSALPQSPPPLEDIFKIVYYEARTVSKRAVGILLDCFLVP